MNVDRSDGGSVCVCGGGEFQAWPIIHCSICWVNEEDAEAKR